MGYQPLIYMKLSLIVAMDSHRRVIGCDDGLPWRLSPDLKHFRSITMGKPVVMGRKTHESIGKPLPGRDNIVLTRLLDYHAEGCTVVNSIDELLDYCRDEEELMITGGAEVYQLFINCVDRMYITEVHAEVEGNTFFPTFNTNEWYEISRENYSANDSNDYDYSFVEWLAKRCNDSNDYDYSFVVLERQ